MSVNLSRLVTKPTKWHVAHSEDWSDWADAQADLSLRWAHSHFVGFVMRQLNCTQSCAWLCKWWMLSFLTPANGRALVMMHNVSKSVPIAWLKNRMLLTEYLTVFSWYENDVAQWWWWFDKQLLLRTRLPNHDHFFVTGFISGNIADMSRDMTKPTKWVCAQRRLRSAWASAQSDQSSLCTQWVAKDPSFLHADSENSDQTGRMPRLIWVFAGRPVTLLVLSWGGSHGYCSYGGL